jgi:hypothetical protein
MERERGQARAIAAATRTVRSAWPLGNDESNDVMWKEPS